MMIRGKEAGGRSRTEHDSRDDAISLMELGRLGEKNDDGFSKKGG